MKKGEIKVRELLSHRSFVMAMAIMMIVLYHSKLSFGVHVFYFFTTFLFLGVDVFMFATGIGSYYSLKKSSYIDYLKKRLIRISIPYLLFMALWLPYAYIYRNIGVDGVIGNLFGVEWLFSNTKSFNWYISAIIIFYLLMPIFVKAVNKYGFWTIMLGSIILSLLFINNKTLIIISSRLPVLMLGIYAGKMADEDRSINLKMGFLMVLLMVFGIVLTVYLHLAIDENALWNYGLFWYPHLLIVPGLSFVLALIAGKIKDSSLYGYLSGLGSYTFEIYLLHIMMFDVYRRIIKPYNLSLWKVEAGTVVISIMAIVLGKLFKQLSDNIRSHL